MAKQQKPVTIDGIAGALSITEMRALHASVYNYDLMVGEMQTIEGITPAQTERERAKVDRAKRALRKLRAARKGLKAEAPPP